MMAKNEQSFIFAGRLYVESYFTNNILRVVPIARTNIVCSGNENTLSECRYNGVDGNSACEHNFDILIRCDGKPLRESSNRG